MQTYQYSLTQPACFLVFNQPVFLSTLSSCYMSNANGFSLPSPLICPTCLVISNSELHVTCDLMRLRAWQGPRSTLPEQLPDDDVYSPKSAFEEA